MDWITLLPAVIIVTVIALIWKRSAVYSTWKKLGIHGPTPTSLFLGNSGDLFQHGFFNMNEEWTRKYGKVYGYYEGPTPVLCVSDPDMVKEILIKQSENFNYRTMLLDNSSDPFADLVVSKAGKWKRLRGITSPTFSGKKMKMMSPLVHQSIDKLMKRFSEREHVNTDFDIYDDLKCLTLDVIASTVFSYDTDVFNTSDSIFLKKLTELFDTLNPTKFNLLDKLKFLTLISFPKLLPIVQMFQPRIAAIKNQWFIDLAKTMITERQQSGEVRTDYIQLMLNANRPLDSKTGSGTDTDTSDNEMEKQLRSTAKSKYLTMAEMQGQTTVFLAAGYETTATTLAFIFHYLALYPDIQAKLHSEIDEHFPTQGKNINYETVQKLPYLDMVFCEVSRLASIGQIAVQRQCTKTTQVGKITIPQGAKVMINIADIHKSPELWGPEPMDEFVPERFLPERKGARHPMAYLPFGGGPRNCIGMRFALMEAKMALINTLQRYTINRCEKTQVPLKTTKDGVHGPAEGVFVRLMARN